MFLTLVDASLLKRYRLVNNSPSSPIENFFAAKITVFHMQEHVFPLAVG